MSMTPRKERALIGTRADRHTPPDVFTLVSPNLATEASPGLGFLKPRLVWPGFLVFRISMVANLTAAVSEPHTAHSQKLEVQMSPSTNV